MFKNLNFKKTQSEYKFFFEKNKKDRKILIYILCGYKKYLHSSVFNRFKKYMNIDADVCLVSPGLLDKELFDLAKKNGWSYMSTSLNNVSVAQNLVILKYAKAETIIKMDEDIFVTKNTFSNLLITKKQLDSKKIKYAFIAPLLNVNGFASVKYLELINKLKIAEAKFGKLKYTYGPKRCLAENNFEFVKFLWNITNKTMSLDKSNEYLNRAKIDNFLICNHYFSIGLILFSRDYWNKIGLFYVSKPNSLDLGNDEWQFNNRRFLNKYKRIICQKSICGHFSFGPTNKEMKEFYLTHKQYF